MKTGVENANVEYKSLSTRDEEQKAQKLNLYLNAKINHGISKDYL